MRIRKLLVLATVCWVAPLAGQPSSCPFAQAGAVAARERATATLSDGVPDEGSLFDIAHHSAALAP
jgi:hypothetical protein